jgi:hypothetical protein
MSTKGKRKMLPKPAAIMTVPVDPLLKELIGQAADGEGIPMNEWVARLAANALQRPELAEVPRKQMGRPRNAYRPLKSHARPARKTVGAVK